MTNEEKSLDCPPGSYNEFEQKPLGFCLGIAIRDFLEGREIDTFREVEDDVESTGERIQVTFVDVGDAFNPVVHLDTGDQFTIRIIATGGVIKSEVNQQTGE